METCPQCHGKGKVHGRSEAWHFFLFKCPTCEGKGQTTREKAQKWEDYENAFWDLIFPQKPV